MPNERLYPIKDLRLAHGVDEAYHKKVVKNQLTGERCIVNGDFTPFESYRMKKIENEFAVLLFPDENSRNEIMNRVSIPLQEVTKDLGIQAIFNGVEDLPFHLTLEVGTFVNVPGSQKKTMRKLLVSDDSPLRHVERILTGLTFHLDTLVVAPNSYICAGRFDEEQGSVYKARRIAKRCFKLARNKVLVDKFGEPNFTPLLTYEDIFHLSISRLTGTVSGEVSNRFIDRGREIANEISKRPIAVTIAGTFCDIETSFWVQHVPSLLR
jgi:hypothetical protein